MHTGALDVLARAMTLKNFVKVVTSAIPGMDQTYGFADVFTVIWVLTVVPSAGTR